MDGRFRYCADDDDHWNPFSWIPGVCFVPHFFVRIPLVVCRPLPTVLLQISSTHERSSAGCSNGAAILSLCLRAAWAAATCLLTTCQTTTQSTEWFWTNWIDCQSFLSTNRPENESAHSVNIPSHWKFNPNVLIAGNGTKRGAGGQRRVQIKAIIIFSRSSPTEGNWPRGYLGQCSDCGTL